MISIVFVDMDGTFLAEDKSIPAENMRALDLLVERGIPFVPCTGRPVRGVPQELLGHPATCYAVGSNGAVVYDVKAERPLWTSAMDKTRVLELYWRVCDLELATTFDIFADGRVFAERARYDAMGTYGIDEPTLQVLRRVREPVDLLVPDIVGRAKNVEKVTCFWRNEEDQRGLAQVIDEVGAFSSAHGHPKNFELQARGVSKGSALVWLCSHLGIPTDSAIAFGDEANDLPMLKSAGVGVAMANATPEVLASADCVTATSDDAGVARYLANVLSASCDIPDKTQL